MGGVEEADGVTEETFQHAPVMPDEVLRWLRPECGGVFLDATVGGAGHAIRLLEAGSAVRVIGIDQDAEAIEAARRKLASAGERVKLIRANFRDVARPGFAAEMDGLAGALMDLGVSSHQIDRQERGFSFRPGTPLRMRMDETARETRSAAELLNRADERELGRVFRDGEERRWRTLSREVVRRRKIRPFSTSDDLVAALSAVLGRSAQEKQKARLFQALRIAVNDELAALSEGLDGIRGRLAPGGRLAVLSYHSLEDRLVKSWMDREAARCICPPELPVCACDHEPSVRFVRRRVVRPSATETDNNPRSRSARLRAVERI